VATGERRSGRVGLDAGWVNLLTGLPNEEGLHRWLYWSGNFAREHRVDLKTASLTDSPSHVWSLPSVLAGSGVEFLSIGSNSDRSDFWKFGADRSYQPVWWEGPDGARVLTMVHKHYAEATTVGLTMSLEAAEQRLPGYLADVYDNPNAKEPYPYNVIHLHGAYSDNVQLDENLPAVVEQWNAKYEWPRLILGTNADFFERLRVEAATVVRGDQGAYWEDGAASSAAETKLNRDNVRRLVLLEALLAGLHAQGKIRDYPQSLITEAWENALLYDEHTWGAHHSISLPDDPQTLTLFAVKAGYAMKSHLLCEQLQKIVEEALAFSDNWERDRRDAVAPEADSLGFRSAYLAVDVDPHTGFVRSIRAADDGHEFVERPAADAPPDPAVRPGFGQVLYYAKSRRDPPHSGDVAVGSTLSTPKLLDVQRRDRSIVSRYEHDVLGIVELEVSVAADAPDMECIVRMKGKRPVLDLEGVYVAFPFTFKQPQIDYEVGGAVVQAGRDWMPRACLDWFSVQDFVRIQDPKTGNDVVWSSPDAPLVSLQDVNTHKKLESLPIENGRIYSYLMNNYWHTNYQAQQGGDFEFRYFIRFGKRTSLSEAGLRATRWSAAIRGVLENLVDVASENVRVQAFKRAEDGNGYILRLREVDGKHGDVTFSLGAFADRGIASVEIVSGTEHAFPHAVSTLAIEGLDVTTHLHPFETQTLRVLPRVQ
jgi:alpha-mannosidase